MLCLTAFNSLLSDVLCTFGPHQSHWQEPFENPHACPDGGYSQLKCRPDPHFQDCGPGFECIKNPILFKMDQTFYGVCCPIPQKCPPGLIEGPKCHYNKHCPGKFTCHNGWCCKDHRHLMPPRVFLDKFPKGVSTKHVEFAPHLPRVHLNSLHPPIVKLEQPMLVPTQQQGSHIRCPHGSGSAHACSQSQGCKGGEKCVNGICCQIPSRF
ncbi:hypothetical protein DPMN_181291 [Dreissena polymorpha]|uniref:WAP domain-containing protein n=1 Tax=Dreissena polymorpha TaxID=45954 RepID=A0A9D4I3M7_DREPO|nr:hypothetical protein DPMN_181291 [Dreissena polymorpha]